MAPVRDDSAAQNGYPPVEQSAIDRAPALPPTTQAWTNIASFEPDIQTPPSPESQRTPTGSTIGDPDSILHDDSGRTYHGYKDGRYLVPNDGEEQDRLDLQHAAICLLLDGRLNLAPIISPEYVLDVATGTGIWAIDFAREHPTAKVYGTDLSLIQPTEVASNCTFIREDAEEDEWYHGHSHLYDYIHMRFTFSCFNDPKKVIRNCYKYLQPGGWLEYHEVVPAPGSMDNNLKGTAWEKVWDLWDEGFHTLSRNIRFAPHLKESLEEAGFVDVVELKMIWPGSNWPSDPKLKKCGIYTQEEVYGGLRGILYKPLEKAGLEPAEIERLTVDAQKSMTDPKLRWFWPFYVVYGRKPEVE